MSVSRHETRERGTAARRRAPTSCAHVPDDLPDRHRWPKLTAIGMAISDTVRDGKHCYEHALLHPEQEALGETLRRRGPQPLVDRESLHWQLDVTFQEDQSRLRRGHADANFSILRRTALSLLKNNHTLKVGVKNKRLAAGWDDAYLEQVLFGQ